MAASPAVLLMTKPCSRTRAARPHTALPRAKQHFPEHRGTRESQWRLPQGVTEGLPKEHTWIRWRNPRLKLSTKNTHTMGTWWKPGMIPTSPVNTVTRGPAARAPSVSSGQVALQDHRDPEVCNQARGLQVENGHLHWQPSHLVPKGQEKKSQWSPWSWNTLGKEQID